VVWEEKLPVFIMRRGDEEKLRRVHLCRPHTAPALCVCGLGWKGEESPFGSRRTQEV